MNVKTADLAKYLKDAIRYIEVKTAYQGAMTAEQVEAAIKANRNIGEVRIGANSCCELARFNLDEARAALDRALA